MRYGHRPPEMSLEDWTIECQCRHIAREMRQVRGIQARRGVFERWAKKMPGVSKDRVAEIWREGVPMPDNTTGTRR